MGDGNNFGKVILSVWAGVSVPLKKEILREDRVFHGCDVPAFAGGNFESVYQQIRHFSFHICSAKGLKYDRCILLSKF